VNGLPQAAIDLATMADPINPHKLCMVIDGVKDPVVAGPHALFSISPPNYRLNNIPAPHCHVIGIRVAASTSSDL